MCLSNKKIRDRFETEATTMAMLHHRNIVVVHDIRDEVYEDPAGIVFIKIVYMDAEMLPGGSLQDRIDDHGPLHPQQVLDAIAMAEDLDTPIKTTLCIAMLSWIMFSLLRQRLKSN